jgi:hypothetical protein
VVLTVCESKECFLCRGRGIGTFIVLSGREDSDVLWLRFKSGWAGEEVSWVLVLAGLGGGRGLLDG